MRRSVLLGLVLLAAVALFPQQTEQALAQTTQVLVSNINQPDGARGGLGNDHAQAFTTGGDSTGYTLTSVDMEFARSEAGTTLSRILTVTIQSDSGGNPSGTIVGTLTNPAFVSTNSDRTYTFSAPGAGIALAANTKYWFVLDVDSGTVISSNNAVRNTSSDADDAGGAPGWSIADDSRYRQRASTGGWTSFHMSKKIRINGPVAAVTPNADGVYPVPHDWALTPDGLDPGDRFRLLFVTSGTTPAQSMYIDDYNRFVQGFAASGHAAIRPYSHLFKAIGETSRWGGNDLYSNTGLWSGGLRVLPIYWLDGKLIVRKGTEFVSSGWYDESSYTTENGTTHTSGRCRDASVGCWTGISNLLSVGYLGGAGKGSGQTIHRPNVSALGVMGHASHTPLTGLTKPRSHQASMYAVSPVFVVAHATAKAKVTVSDGTEGGNITVTVTIPEALSSTVNFFAEVQLCTGGSPQYVKDACNAGRGSVSANAEWADMTPTFNLPISGDHPSPMYVRNVWIPAGQTSGSATFAVHDDTTPEQAKEVIAVRVRPGAGSRYGTWKHFALDWLDSSTPADGADSHSPWRVWASVLSDNGANAPVDPVEVQVGGAGGGYEGDRVSFAIQANLPPGVRSLPAPLDVSITISSSGDIGVTGETKTVTIPVMGSLNVHIPTTDDANSDADSSVRLTINAGHGYTVNPLLPSQTVNLLDKEPPTPQLVVEPQPPHEKYAALVKSFYDRITANAQHGDGASGGWNKRLLKAMGHPEYVNYPQAAVTVADAQRIWDHPSPGANTAWDGTVEAVTYAEQYFAGQTPTPEITISGGSGVTEGGTATFTISASPAPASPITVNVGVSQSGDFGATGAATVTVIGATTTYTVSTSDDDADEADGSVTATVQAGSGYTIGAASSASVNVADNDDPAPEEGTAELPADHPLVRYAELIERIRTDMQDPNYRGEKHDLKRVLKTLGVAEYAGYDGGTVGVKEATNRRTKPRDNPHWEGIAEAIAYAEDYD